MSIATGLDPATLLDLDARMYDAVERAAGARWTVADELLAASLELAHAHYRAFLSAYSGGKRVKLPDPLTVPRPGAEGFDTPPVISPAAFASEFGEGVVARA